MRKRLWVGSALAGCVVALGACNLPTDPSDERNIGTIQFTEADPVRIEAPATAPAGTSFEVRVTTYGGGCIRQGDTEVQTDGLRSTITPFDVNVTPPAGGACTDDLRLYQHVAQVRFDAAGEARVIIRGYSRTLDRIITVERTVIVS